MNVISSKNLNVRNLTKESLKPTARTPIPSQPIMETGNEVLYQLNYIHANAQKFKLVRFPSTADMDEIIHLSKKYCARANWRFVFIEPAIITIEPENEDGD